RCRSWTCSDGARPYRSARMQQSPCVRPGARNGGTMRRQDGVLRFAGVSGTVCVLWFSCQSAQAQTIQTKNASPVAAPSLPEPSNASVRLPSDYVIGPEDQLSVVFFQNKDASADVVVRPDGKISLPLLNEIQASGLTPEQLRGRVGEQAKRYFQDPNA